MGQSRVRGNNAKLYLVSESLFYAPIPMGEIDSFKAKSGTTIIKSRPVGFINEQATQDYHGWDLTIKFGKVDWTAAYFYFSQDQALRSGNEIPTFCVVDEIKHLNGATEQYIYKNVVFHGFDINKAEEITEEISAFSSHRDMGPVDTTTFSSPDNLVIMGMYKIIFDNKLKDITRPF